jgi:hypothetical protein
MSTLGDHPDVVETLRRMHPDQPAMALRARPELAQYLSQMKERDEEANRNRDLAKVDRVLSARKDGDTAEMASERRRPKEVAARPKTSHGKERDGWVRILAQARGLAGTTSLLVTGVTLASPCVRPQCSSSP